jgi:YfiH family protein
MPQNLKPESKMTLLDQNWLAADWPAPKSINAGTTLRTFNGISGESLAASKPPFDGFNLASHVGDDLDAVKQNRTLLQTPTEPCWLEQTHTTLVAKLPSDKKNINADAAYTTHKQVICAVLTADCLPLLVTDIQGQCVAAIHAGWRGLCHGIIEATIKALPVAPDDLLVWLGPAIGEHVYEVGEEVYYSFTQNDPGAEAAFTPVSSGHWLLNMYTMARLRLNRIGVTKIFGGGLCTFTDEQRFYSYRRNARTGRMASLIWIENN